MDQARKSGALRSGTDDADEGGTAAFRKVGFESSIFQPGLRYVLIVN